MSWKLSKWPREPSNGRPMGIFRVPLKNKPLHSFLRNHGPSAVQKLDRLPFKPIESKCNDCVSELAVTALADRPRPRDRLSAAQIITSTRENTLSGTI